MLTMDKSFSIKSNNGLLRRLKAPCCIAPHGGDESAKIEFSAMFDTGATGSIITQKVVEACGLKPTRKSFLQGVHGVEKTEAYSVDIYLPSAITFHKVHVVKGNYCNGGWEVIIGMDLIAIGEFSVRNVGSNTEFSFSLPSQSRRSEMTSKGALNWLRGLVGRGAT